MLMTLSFATGIVVGFSLAAVLVIIWKDNR